MALENYLKSLKIEEEIGNKRLIVTTTSTIDGVYIKLRNYPVAIEYEKKALKWQLRLISLTLLGIVILT